MMKMIPAEFQGMKLDILDHEGKRWLTAEQIGQALGYDEANARKGVLKLYERHGDEFTEADTGVVRLTTPGGSQAARVFSDTGCIKLGFFASTARAKDFRAWAAKVLAGQRTMVQPAPLRRGIKARVTREVECQVLEMFVGGYSQKEMADALRLSRTSINLLIHAKYAFAPGLGPSLCSPELISQVTARHMEIEADRLAREQDRIAQKFLTSARNLELAESLEYVGQCALDGSLAELAS